MDQSKIDAIAEENTLDKIDYLGVIKGAHAFLLHKGAEQYLLKLDTMYPEHRVIEELIFAAKYFIKYLSTIGNN